MGEHYLAHYSDEWSQAYMLPQSDVTFFKSFSHMKPSPALKQQESQEVARGWGLVTTS